MYKIVWIFLLISWIIALWYYHKGKESKVVTYCAYISTIVSIVEELLK